MTSAQILAALQISNLFELLNLTAPYNTGEFTDITDWAALNISSGAGDTVKIIAKVVNPVGIVVHENAGYATDSYTSPDTDLTSLTSDPFTLANLTGTHTAVDGNYTFYIKCQVSEGVSTGAMGVSITQTATVSLPQISLAAIVGIPVAGDIVSLSYSGVAITYTAQSGDSASDVANGLYNAIQTYRAANILSAWNINLLPSIFVPGIIRITATQNNVPFTLIDSYTQNSPTSILEVEKQFSVELNQNIIPSLSLGETYNCNNATYTSVDSTDYATPATQQGFTITNITRVHVTQPPLNSTKSDGTTPQTSVSSSSQTNLLAADDNPLWTGSYQSSIQPTVTYRKGNDYTTIRVPVYTEAVTVACDEDLCELFCCLKTLISSYNTYRSTNTAKAQEFLAKWDAGNRYLIAIREAKACNNGDLVTSYTALFYAVTECNPDCDCGCTDGPAPVIPTVSINGADGTDGSQILTGTTAPSGATGAVGDYYINTTNGFLYKKTGLSAWTYLFTMVGAAGAAGTNGTNAYSVLANQFPALSTLTTNFESLLVGRVPYDLAADQLTADGDELNVFAQFSSSSPAASYSQAVKLSFAGTDLLGAFDLASFYSLNVGLIKLYARIVRTSNTTVNYQVTIQYFGDTNSPSITRAMLQQTQTDITGLGTLNLTTTSYEIDALAKSVVIGDITCDAFEVIYNHQS